MKLASRVLALGLACTILSLGACQATNPISPPDETSPSFNGVGMMGGGGRSDGEDEDPPTTNTAAGDGLPTDTLTVLPL